MHKQWSPMIWEKHELWPTLQSQTTLNFLNFPPDYKFKTTSEPPHFLWKPCAAANILCISALVYFHISSVSFHSISLIFRRWILGTWVNKYWGQNFYNVILTSIIHLANAFVPVLDEMSRKCNGTWCKLHMDVPTFNLSRIHRYCV